jgi:hypothetical protein
MLSLYVFICTYITHTQTHTRSLFISLTLLYVCDRERGGGSFSLSMCVCVIEKGEGKFECILQLLASLCRTYLSQCARTERILRFEIADS